MSHTSRNFYAIYKIAASQTDVTIHVSIFLLHHGRIAAFSGVEVIYIEFTLSFAWDIDMRVNYAFAFIDCCRYTLFIFSMLRELHQPRPILTETLLFSRPPPHSITPRRLLIFRSGFEDIIMVRPTSASSPALPPAVLATLTGSIAPLVSTFSL